MSFEEKIYSFLDDLKLFQYKYDFGDRGWRVIFKHKKTKWHKMSVQQYQDTFYIGLMDNDDIPTLEVKLKKMVSSRAHSLPRSPFGYNREEDEEDREKIWTPYINSVQQWMKQVKRDWIKANAVVTRNYPLNYRSGYVSHALVRALIPDIYRLDLALGAKNVNKFLKIVESRYFYDKSKATCSKMTANRFFDYCKIAYIVAQEKDHTVDKNLSGKKMYEIYADGRHEGLLDIDPDSEDEFSSWLDGTHPKKERGGHPWEIKRGGNTTHINLYVSRPDYTNEKEKGFVITVGTHAVTRLAEALRMFLALYDAGMPIGISDSDSIYRRLLAQDNIGIVPNYESLHRANQDFPEDQDVHDVMYYDDLGKHKRRIKDFIVWESLPMLVPKN